MKLEMENYEFMVRPYDKLVTAGVQSLTVTELVSIVIGSGTKGKDSMELAQSLIKEDSALYRLATAKSIAEIKTDGIGARKSASILAAVELGKRLAAAEPARRKRMAAPQDGALLLMPKLRYETNEHFMLVLLNTKNRVIAVQQVSEGSLNSSVVHPREVFSPAIAQHAAAILVGHNHPSGDPEPSREDKGLTAVLVKTGNLLGIPLIDHIIIGDGIYYSFKEHGYL